jgi:hypothetical protein
VANTLTHNIVFFVVLSCVYKKHVGEILLITSKSHYYEYIWYLEEVVVIAYQVHPIKYHSPGLMVSFLFFATSSLVLVQ